eukprot:TRINITY_DN3665_c0_g1_i17.p1 TRINITY_DN3665_c0_g1~~TRINITY_DN3665_c0_g1_i17.p1  ORF type:complete len:316 (+),score=61.87 TRINITY_DN3665_c0_g1_i17:1-948(+)
MKFAFPSGKQWYQRRVHEICVSKWEAVVSTQSTFWVIHSNIYQAIRTMIQALDDLNVQVSAAHKDILSSFRTPFVDKLTPEMGEMITTLWKDPGFVEIYSRRSEYQLIDSIDYYVHEIERISRNGYVPTEQDVLRSRVQTTGLIETEFSVQNTKFVLVDVGGQRSERKKWMYCFEDVTAVLFVVALSGFDLTLYEDRTTNRMHEALKLFHEICVSKWFTKAAMILFLNKSDLFKEKLEQGKQIKVCFDDYKGDNSYEDTTQFIMDKFTDVYDPVTNKPKEIYAHLTCATDTETVKHIFEAVQDTLLRQVCQGVGL